MRKPNKTELKRIAQMERCIPNIWDHKKVLYVGAYPKRFFFRQAMLDHGCTIDVIEIDEERCEGLRETFKNLKVIHLDVQEVDSLPGKYDMVIWAHGPSTLSQDRITDTIENVEKKGKLIILSCPWGRYQHAISRVRDIDTNKVSLYPSDFESLGYKTDVIGKKDVSGSNLLAWKFMEDVI